MSRTTRLREIKAGLLEGVRDFAPRCELLVAIEPATYRLPPDEHDEVARRRVSQQFLGHPRATVVAPVRAPPVEQSVQPEQERGIGEQITGGLENFVDGQHAGLRGAKEACNAEMIRRLKSSIDRLNTSTTICSAILIVFTLVIITLTIFQMV